MARRKKRIEHDSADRWVISYADFITLLFAVFVVLYSISSVNEAKYKIFSDSLSIAFTNQAAAASPAVLPNKQEQMLKALVDKRTARLGEQQRKIEDRMKAVADGLTQVMSTMIAQGAVNVTRSKRGVVIDISASSLFNTGDAALQADAAAVLKEVALMLSREDQPIEVEGYTDDVPIKTPQFPSNWELSSARASSVVRMLIEQGVPQARLSAVGMASNQPIVANDSPEHRAKNRRVRITVLSPDTEHLMPPASP